MTGRKRHIVVDTMGLLLAGAVMMGWIVGEILILKKPFSSRPWVEVFYFGVGLIMAVLGLMMRRAERKRRPSPGLSG